MKKKNKIWIYTLIVMGFAVFLIYSCKKDNSSNNNANNNNNITPPTVQEPVLTTTIMSNIAQTIASSGGNITSDGGAAVTARGVCWSTIANFSPADNSTTNGTGTGSFSSNMTGLIPNTTYYVKAYATNSEGTGYGNILTFKTLAAIPDTVFTVLCSPQANSINFSGQLQTFGTSYGTNGLLNGNYGLVGNGSYSDLRIEFSQEPVTGKYITSDPTSFMSPTQCNVNGTFGGTMSYHYDTSAGDTVYVKKNGTGKYSMTFCHLTFSGSSGFTFTSDGNLTSQ